MCFRFQALPICMCVALSLLVWSRADRATAQPEGQTTPDRPSNSTDSDDVPDPPQLQPNGLIAPEPDVGLEPLTDEAESDESLLPLVPPRSALASTVNSTRARLTRIPNMYGDFLGSGSKIFVNQFSTNVFVLDSELPLGGGGRRSKIAENSKALPDDRIYFMYNHFHNAQQAVLDFDEGSMAKDQHVDQYTIGFEKTFWGDDWSLDLRMPFANTSDLVNQDGIGLIGGDVGNLTLTVKTLLLGSRCFALASGVGFGIPTGDDVYGTTEVLDFVVNNDALHVLPFLSFMSIPHDSFFVHGFAQLDIAANGNQIEVNDPYKDFPFDLGELDDQNLLHLDIAGGCWLYQNRCSRGLTGLASLVELHYTTTIQDADKISSTGRFTELSFGNLQNRFDVLNLTAGLHAEFCRMTSVRIAAAFPLRSEGQAKIADENRIFDSEVQFQINRRF